jgi:hypothetical protein
MNDKDRREMQDQYDVIQAKEEFDSKKSPPPIYIPITLMTVGNEEFIAWPIQVRVPSAGESIEYEEVGYYVDAVHWHISPVDNAVSVQLVCK